MFCVVNYNRLKLYKDKTRYTYKMSDTTIKIDRNLYPTYADYYVSPQYRKDYYQLNKKVLLEKGKKYYEDNKEIIKEKNKKYYEDNKEKAAKTDKEYYENNKEKIKERSRKYHEDNKEKNKEKIKERAGQKLKCECCGKEVRRDGLKKHQENKSCREKRAATAK